MASPSSPRLYSCARLGQSVTKYCLIGLRNGSRNGRNGVRNGEFGERAVVTSASGLGDTVRASPSNAFDGRFSGFLRFSGSSEGWERRKQLQTVECTNSSSAEASFERRRQKYLEKIACPGCGVYMQDKDPSRPGYFKMPAVLTQAGEEFEEEIEGDEDEMEEFADDTDDGLSVRAELNDMDFEFENEDDDDDEEVMDMNTRLSVATEWNEVDSRQAGKDAWAEILGGKKFSKKDEVSDEEESKIVVCARCHALRNYGKVKDENAENLLPDFDFERVVGARLKKAYGRRAVVLMVVDGSDFDGSFPRKAAEVLAEADEELGTAWQEGKAGNSPRLLVVMNKIDLLPKQVSPNRLEQWVRRRSKSGGVGRIAGVHLVSAFKGWGVEQLAENIKQLAGPRGDCWVVGAQNAGKSSLINSLAKYAGMASSSPSSIIFCIFRSGFSVNFLDGVKSGEICMMFLLFSSRNLMSVDSDQFCIDRAFSCPFSIFLWDGFLNVAKGANSGESCMVFLSFWQP